MSIFSRHVLPSDLREVAEAQAEPPLPAASLISRIVGPREVAVGRVAPALAGSGSLLGGATVGPAFGAAPPAQTRAPEGFDSPVS